jgi:pimeloyl-ACP methyl ester carboxylesterase
MALQQPQRFGAMVLVAGPHYLGPEARKMVREDTFDRLEPEVQQFYRTLHPGGQPQVDLIFRQYHGLEYNREDIAPEVLSTLPVPVLLVWGDRDGALPLEIPLKMYRSLPHAALWVLPGQGHAPLWSDLEGDAGTAERFVEVVKGFMTRQAVEVVGK